MNLLEYLKENDNEIKNTQGSDMGYKRSNFMKGKISSGLRLVVNGNSSGHNYGEIGTELNLSSNFTTSLTGSVIQSNRSVTGLIFGGNSIQLRELDVVESYTIEYLNERVKNLNDQKKKLNESIKETKDKISFMKANGIEKFNDDEFKVFKVLAVMDESTSAIEKSKIIAKIVKG